MGEPIRVDHLPCLSCGKEILRRRKDGRLEDGSNFRRRKYCDRACMADTMKKQMMGSWNAARCAAASARMTEYNATRVQSAAHRAVSSASRKAYNATHRAVSSASRAAHPPTQLQLLTADQRRVYTKLRRCGCSYADALKAAREAASTN